MSNCHASAASFGANIGQLWANLVPIWSSLRRLCWSTVRASVQRPVRRRVIGRVCIPSPPESLQPTAPRCRELDLFKAASSSVARALPKHTFTARGGGRERVPPKTTLVRWVSVAPAASGSDARALFKRRLEDIDWLCLISGDTSPILAKLRPISVSIRRIWAGLGQLWDIKSRDPSHDAFRPLFGCYDL